MNHIPPTAYSDETVAQSAVEVAAEPIVVTMENVHTLSTFELRQACKERGIELPQAGALQEFMIKSLVSLMVAQQRQKEKEAFEKMQAESEIKKVRMLEEKEERKAEAKERSRLRREAQAAAEAKFRSEQAALVDQAEPAPEPESPEEGLEGPEDQEAPKEKPQMTQAFRDWFQKIVRVRTAWPKPVQEKAAGAQLDVKRQENFEQADATKDGMLDLVEYIDYTKLEYAHFCQCTGHRAAYDRKMMLLHKEGFECHPKTGAGGKVTLDDIGLQNEWQQRLFKEMQG